MPPPTHRAHLPEPAHPRLAVVHLLGVNHLLQQKGSRLITIVAELGGEQAGKGGGWGGWGGWQNGRWVLYRATVRALRDIQGGS